MCFFLQKVPLMGCVSWCLGQEYLFTGKTGLQLCWYPETPRISINYFHRLCYSSYIVINSSATAKCLLRSGGKKRITLKISFRLEWMLNLNLSYLNWAGIFHLKEKFLVFACVIQLSSESMSDCIIKSMPMRHSGGGDPSETPALSWKALPGSWLSSGRVTAYRAVLLKYTLMVMQHSTKH